MAETILVVDDDPDIARFVEVNLALEGYEVLTAADGEEALAMALDRKPDLVILDVMMPKLDGYGVCQRLRADSRTAHVGVIMLTAKSLSADKVVGLTAGADDYMIKPFDPLELVARVKSTLRRAQDMRALSPLTGLPGNLQIEREIRNRIAAREPLAILHADLDNFKAFNDRYGFLRGDEAIRVLARTLIVAAESYPGTFVGHVGGDDFVVVTSADAAEDYCRSAVEGLRPQVPPLYDPEDAARGAIEIVDRQRRRVSYPLLTLSIGGATNARPGAIDHRELAAIASEMKTYVKGRGGGGWALDRRGNSVPP